MTRPANWHFEYLAPIYDYLPVGRDRGRVIDAFDVEEPVRVLDLGGGTGELLEYLIDQGVAEPATSCLVDFSQSMLEQAKPRLGGSVVRGDSHCLPLKEGTFEGVFMGDTLHHMNNPKTVLTEIHTVLGSDGRIVIEEFDPSTVLGTILEWTERAFGMGSRFMTPEVLTSWLEEAGYVDVEVHGSNFNYVVSATA